MFSLKKLMFLRTRKFGRHECDFLNIRATQNMKTEMINFSVSFIKAKKLKINNAERTTTIS